MNYSLSTTPPTAEEYCYLRKVGGVSEKTIEAATLALPRSLFTVCIRCNNTNQLLAMGRVIGDLGCHVQVCDIVVHPDQQGCGLGKQIMTSIMNFIHKEVPRCAFVNLFADVDFLYGKYGFVCSNKSIGMYLDWSKLESNHITNSEELC